jgi:hypothetical protein
MRFSHDRNLVLNCCNEFLRMLSDEANEVCSKSKKQTIMPDHVIESLKTLGFESWVTEADKAHQDYVKVRNFHPEPRFFDPLPSSDISTRPVGPRPQSPFTNHLWASNMGS